MKIWWLAALLLIPCSAWAACPAPVGTVYTPVDLTAAEIQDCIDDAEAASGGTISLPAGASTLTKATGASYKVITKSLTIQGAGTDESTGTRLTASTQNEMIFWFRVDGTATLTIKDMRLTVYTGTNTNGVVNVFGVSPNKIITNIYFNGTPATGNTRFIAIGGETAGSAYGLIHNNWFEKNNANSVQAITVWGNAQGSYDYWNGNPEFGTANALYVENNTFNYASAIDGAVDGGHGAQVVFRYNNVIGTNFGWHGMDSDTGSWHSAEVYRNAFTGAVGSPNITNNLRGGTAVIWGNTGDSTYAAGLTLALYRACSATGAYSTICQGASAKDGNGAVRGGVGGYPCYQQPGTTGTTGLVQWPMIAWNNSINGTQATFGNNTNYVNPTCGQTYDQDDYVQEGRDFVNYDTCEGVTSDFCTAWWDDTNNKAKLNGSEYTTYTCPHPLAGYTGKTCNTTAGRSGYGVDAPVTATHRGVSVGGGVWR